MIETGASSVFDVNNTVLLKAPRLIWDLALLSSNNIPVQHRRAAEPLYFLLLAQHECRGRETYDPG